LTNTGIDKTKLNCDTYACIFLSVYLLHTLTLCFLVIGGWQNYLFSLPLPTNNTEWEIHPVVTEIYLGDWHASLTRNARAHCIGRIGWDLNKVYLNSNTKLIIFKTIVISNLKTNYNFCSCWDRILPAKNIIYLSNCACTQRRCDCYKVRDPHEYHKLGLWVKCLWSYLCTDGFYLY